MWFITMTTILAATIPPPLPDRVKFTSSCTAMQQIANAPGATAGTFVNDQPKLFYSTDGTSAPCKASASYTSIASIFKHIVATLTNARLVPTGTS